MKINFYFLISFTAFISISSFSQQTTDAYKAENDGYFIHPMQTSGGVVFTDNLCSKIYSAKSNELKELVSAPGCGRYFTISPDRSKIGFKLIKTDGTQVPAVYDMASRQIIELSTAVKLCGQVSFTSDGRSAFTIGNNLTIVNEKNSKSVDLGVYANIAPISPDGNSVVFNSESDQLFWLDVSTGKKIQITDNIGGYMYPQWSPDGSRILFSSMTGNLFIWEKTTNKTFPLGAGENANWSEDSKSILFDRTITENFQFKGSDIYLAKADGSSIIKLSNSSDANEMFPSFGENNTVLYSTYEKKEIISAKLDAQDSKLTTPTSLLKKNAAFLGGTNYYPAFCSSQKNLLTNTLVPGTVPYVHQVYDTPDWHYGSGSCAPTTSIMALAYYNRLPYWDITCSSPTSHIS
ncbi:MAG TPA: hypothetical protein VII99_09855, partial [Bacteroidia bacterium]